MKRLIQGTVRLAYGPLRILPYTAGYRCSASRKHHVLSLVIGAVDCVPVPVHVSAPLYLNVLLFPAVGLLAIDKLQAATGPRCRIGVW